MKVLRKSVTVKARLLPVFGYEILRQPKFHKGELNRCLHGQRFFQFARHGRALMGASPEHAQVGGNV